MSAKDVFHEVVKIALQKWMQITHESIHFTSRNSRTLHRFGAERVVAAEKDGQNCR